MVMISLGGEARTPSSYHGMASPRYGGCVGAFLHFFDWNPGKRFYSTKRLNASKPEEGLRRSRSLRSDHGSAVRTRMIFDSPPGKISAEGEDCSSVSQGDSGRVFSADDVSVSSSRPPSVVARLMGLDSLPKGPYHPARHHRRSQSCSGAGELPFSYMASRVEEEEEEEPPVVLQELLQPDFKASKKSLRDRMPGFAKRAQEQCETRFSKKGAVLKVLRCRRDECVSPYRNVPDVVQLQSKQPFLLRLASATATPRDASPADVSSPAIVAELVGGWPSAGQVSRESSFRSERSSLLESACICRRPALTKASKPALAMVARKIFQGRRRDSGSSWNDSEDSESTSPQVELEFRPPPQHRKPHVAAREPPMKKVTKSLSPPARLDRTIRAKAATRSIRDFKTPGTRIPAMPKAVQSIRRSSITDDSALRDQRQPLFQSKSRSTDFQFSIPESATSRRSSPSSGSQRAISTASQISNVSPTATVTPSRSKRPGGANFTKNSKQDVVPAPAPPNLPTKAPLLDGYRAPKVTKHNQKAGSQKRTANPTKPLPAENANAPKGGAASSKPSTKNTLQGIQRVRVTMHATTASPLSDRLNRDELATPSNSAQAADETSFRSRANSPASKHTRARSVGAVSKDTPVPISTEPDPKKSKPVVVTAASESVCEPVFQVDLQEFFATGSDDLRWEEDEERRVEPESPDERSGRFCERSCSGPSVSSASVDVSDVEDERNGDAWSSCASYNAADCDSPRAFELPDDDDDCDLHDSNSTPMYVPKLSTTHDPADEPPSQPSPVSILHSPFHDEPCTPSTSDEDPRELPSPQTAEEPPPPPPPPTGELRQALLDHSLLQSFTFSYKEVSGNPKESVQGFVLELLSPPPPPLVISTPADSYSSPNLPEFHDCSSSIRTTSTDCTDLKPEVRLGNLWVDAVNEFVALRGGHHGRCHEIVPWKACCCRGERREGVGVEEVYAKVEEWRRLTAVSIDLLVDREMRDWEGWRWEVAMVGGEIENWIWTGVVEEVVVDLVARGKPRGKAQMIEVEV